MTGPNDLLRSRWGLVILGAIAAGLLLRLLAAHGGLWTDEAWSMLYAEAARTPTGVFLRINHDNNHHLVSLWLQAIGPAAAPVLARAPSILAGTATILVAALFASRRSAAAGALAAIMFAVAPMLVHIGSEARGYAPMLLAATTTLMVVDDWLAGRLTRRAGLQLALLAVAGLLSHLTMVAAIGLAMAWAYFEQRRAQGPTRALTSTLRLFAPALAASFAVLALVALAAAADPRGFSVGGYAPFAWGQYATALRDLVTYTGGVAPPIALLSVIGAALLAAIWFCRADLGRRASLYALLLIGTPLAVAVLQPGNAGFARYYLLSSAGALLLLAELAGSRRPPAVVLVTALVALGAWRDVQLIKAEHGQPDRPIAIIKSRDPQGTTLALGTEGLRAVVLVAARRHRLPLQIPSGCARADYLLEPLAAGSALPAQRERCGRRFDRIAAQPLPPLSGQGWALYSARPLQ